MSHSRCAYKDKQPLGTGSDFSPTSTCGQPAGSSAPRAAGSRAVSTEHTEREADVGTRPSLRACVNSEAFMADSGSVLCTPNCGPDHVRVSAGSKPQSSPRVCLQKTEFLHLSPLVQQ